MLYRYFKDGCQTKVSPFWVALVTVGSVLAIGIIVILTIKVIVCIMDFKERRAFDNDIKEANTLLRKKSESNK